MTTEKRLETKLREEVKAYGGIALKFSSSSHTGIPDRMLLLPGGRIIWVEVKSPGKTPTPIQEIAIKKLRLLGFWVEVVDSEEKLQTLLIQMQ
jgi:hypothetical protein